MLTPLFLPIDDLENVEEVIVDSQAPSKTYKLDLETGEIYAEFIDDGESLKQSIIKSLKTFRSTYLIYSDDYGSELNYLIGQSFSNDYLQLEVPRLIEEALMVDDRIESIEDFIVEKIADELHISFKVNSVFGDALEIEVKLNV